MIYLSIHKSDVSAWFESLKSYGRVYGPRAKENLCVFGPVDKFSDLTLSYISTILPPKKYYFPQDEALLKFQRQSFKTKKAIGTFEEMVLFGVHTCDLAGILCLDTVFRDAPQDPNYLNRKEKIAVIGIECLDYCDSYASCAAVGTHLPKGGHDLMLTDLGEEFAIQVNSEKGQGFVDGRSYIRELDSSGWQKLSRVHEDKQRKFHNEFDSDLVSIDAAFGKGFFAGVWKDVGRRCVGCTNCTSVCPTCYCFDIKDDMEMNLDGGVRRRFWSNCQMEDFAKVATGEDFRPGRDARQRHRYYRKFQYSVEKYNKYFCVGCGRCTRTCMAGISLIETVNALLKETGEGDL